MTQPVQVTCKLDITTGRFYVVSSDEISVVRDGPPIAVRVLLQDEDGVLMSFADDPDAMLTARLGQKRLKFVAGQVVPSAMSQTLSRYLATTTDLGTITFSSDLVQPQQLLDLVIRYRGRLYFVEQPCRVDVLAVEPSIPNTEQTVELDLSLDLPDDSNRIRALQRMTAPYGVPTMFILRFRQLVSDVVWSGVTGAMYLSRNGETLGSVIALEKVSPGVFRGILFDANQVACGIGTEFQYVVSVSMNGVAYPAILPSSLSYVYGGIPENQAPIVTITSPAANAIVPPGPVTINFSASDDRTLTAANFALLVNDVVVSGASISFSGGNGTVTTNLSVLGATVLGIRATDESQLVTTASRSVTCTQPTVTLTAASPVDEGPLSVSVSALSPTPPNGSAVVILDGVTQVASGTLTNGAASLTTSSLAAGSHSLTARVTTVAGNVTSPPVVVTVVNEVPVITFVSPTAGSHVDVGQLQVEMNIAHSSATPQQLSVQISLDPTFATYETAQHVSGTAWNGSVTIVGEANHTVYVRAYDATPGGSPAVATLLVTSLPNYVRFTTTGASFSPELELVSGSSAVLTWSVEEGGVADTTGLEPVINFGSVGVRHVRLTATGGGGLADVTTLNLGFSNLDDAGRFSPGAGYNKAPEACSGIENIGLLTGLRRHLSANGNLTGGLDFTGCNVMEYLEAFGASLTSVVLPESPNFIRACLEANNLTALDLNPVRGVIRDVRAAIQQGGALTFAALGGPLAQCYHFCVRDQTVTGHPTPAQLPVVEELWNWNTGRSGALAPASSALTSLISYQNAWTSVNLTNQFPAGRNGLIDLRQCQISSINVTGCNGLVSFDLRNNLIGSLGIDAFFVEVNSWNTTNGVINVLNCGAPTVATSAVRAALVSRGWTLTHEPEIGEIVGVLSDNFNRADGAVGNGWQSINSAVATISNNQMLRTDSGNYRMMVNPAQNSLPADYTVSMVVDHAGTLVNGGGFLWVVGRWLNGQGVKFGFDNNRTTITCGNASGWQDGNVAVTVTGGIPASWDINQPHTLALRMQGTTCTFFIDGQEYGTATISVNATEAGTGYGVAGEGLNRLWDSIGTSPL